MEQCMGGNAVCFQAVTGAEEKRICWFAKRKISLRRESVCVFFLSSLSIRALLSSGAARSAARSA